MKLKSLRASGFRPILFATITGLVFATTIFAKDAVELHYLRAGHPDAATLVAPPPLPDSAEQAADLEEVRAVYHAASDADKQAAYSEKKFSVFNFAAAVGPFLD